MIGRDCNLHVILRSVSYGSLKKTVLTKLRTKIPLEQIVEIWQIDS